MTCITMPCIAIYYSVRYFKCQNLKILILCERCVAIANFLNVLEYFNQRQQDMVELWDVNTLIAGYNRSPLGINWQAYWPGR